ncbi:phosphoesterase [Marasmius fiardii PR-910]|nr:phosphoesterase [Marasmius fiardii PR-910]
MKANTILGSLFQGLLAASSLATPNVRKPPFGYAPGSAASVANLKDKIKHVVWILLENRSFDNILGGIHLPGLDNPVNNGDICIPQNVSDPHSPTFCTREKDFDSIVNDPDHSVTGNNLEFFGLFAPSNPAIANGTLTATNQGALEKHLISYPTLSPEVAAEQVLGYYSEDEVRTIVDIVHEFTTFNYWFSCVPGPTNPNRLCALAGTADGHGRNDNDFNTASIPVNSIFQEASAKGISWRNYDGTNGDFAPDALFFNWVAENAKSNVVPVENFFQDAYLGLLPQLSYINPSCCGTNTNSMHPSGNVSFGELFIKQIYEAVRNGPHWEDSLLLITYDESGGFHDHVPSPFAVPPDNLTYTETARDGENYTLTFDRLGGRMPTWLISPFTPKAFVEDLGTNPATGHAEAYSATSVLKTLGLLWDIEDFTVRVSNSPSFDHLIGPKARKDTPQTLTTPKPFPKDV